MQRTIKLSQSGIFPVCLLYSTVRCSDAARFDLLLFFFCLAISRGREIKPSPTVE